MDLTSIIVPVYNVEKYLRQCVESLIDQTYKNIEIILINDGSTDNSGYLCDELSKEDKRIKVIHKENEGLGLTRNAGIKVASGKYIIFIDSDDYVKNTMVEDLVRKLIQNKVDICFGGQNKVDNNGKILFSYKYNDEVFRKDLVREKLIPMLIGSSPEAHDNISLSACNVLYCLDLLKKNNIYFKSEREYISEDLIFNIEVINCVNSVMLIEECNYNYRLNLNSLTTTYRNDRFEKIKYLYEYEKELLQKMGHYNFCDDRLIKQFFINLKVCIMQEKTSVSHKSLKQQLNSLHNICSDKLVKELIELYPVNRLKIKQKLFILLVKDNRVIILLLLSKMGVIK